MLTTLAIIAAVEFVVIVVLSCLLWWVREDLQDAREATRELNGLREMWKKKAFEIEDQISALQQVKKED